ncbi:hypothetical protein GDO86_002293 [Hymenochirus boettgeri]|uniref:Uncharacterized protein n=1 Tax=Hymenochirus boettgeri TaxID=247094 RepID=A0A8T2KKC2_9PIPI|nr:hypothetical protein GDO86_002293 [Hymenochirus boettgeri]
MSPSIHSDDLADNVTEAVLHDDDCSDGSTEAAMTLISIGNHAFQALAKGSSTMLDPNVKEDSTVFTVPQSEHQQGDDKADISSDRMMEVPAIESELGDPNLTRSEKIPGACPKIESVDENLNVSGETESGIILLQCFPSRVSDLELSGQDTEVMGSSCVVQSEQHEDTQQSVLSQIDDSPGENYCPTEETTFILTLVEIPINSEYPYSCDSSTCADPLPAPVVISSGPTQLVTPIQSPRSETSMSLPSETNYISCEESHFPVSSASATQKRTSAYEREVSPPNKKALITDSTKEDKLPEDKGNEGKNSYETSACPVQEMTSPGSQQNQETGSLQNSQLSTNRTEMFNENFTVNQTLQACRNGDCTIKQVEFAGTPHSSCEYTPASTSKAPLKRPGKKPLGFLSLVCESRKSNTAKNPRNKKSLKPNCKGLSSRSHNSQTQDLVLNQQVPSATISSSPTVSPENNDAVKPMSSEVSNNELLTPQASSSNELVSEDEDTTVSEYFFSDIFMPVDD